MRRGTRRRGRATETRRGERGSALVELTWLAILLMVPLLYILLAVFEVQRAAFAIRAAADAAGRAYSIAPTEAVAARQARAAAALALRDHGLEGADTDLVVSCRPDPGNCLSPGSVIRVDVSDAVALPLMPAALGSQTPSIRVSARHDVVYGTFREDRP